MKNRKAVSKIGAVLMTSAMVLAMGAPALADGKTYNSASGGDVVVFEKYLSMNKDANVPNVTFNYTIAAGAAQSANAENQTVQIFAGNDANSVSGTPTIAADQAKFQPSDTTYTSVQDAPSTMTANHNDASGDSLKDNLTLGANEKYARKDVKVDFSSVEFKEPGIYRYIITETASSDSGITNDSDPTRILDVYVVDDGVDGSNKPKLKIEGYVLHNTEADAAVKADGTSQQSTKADGFWNKYETKNLTLSKNVSGNQASRDEYFEFTVKISNAVAGTKYDVSGDFDQTTKVTAASPTAKTNPTSITVPAGATEVTQTFWLQHGQNIVINGLALNTAYDINENATTLKNEGYTPSAAITGDTKTGTGDADTVQMVPLTASSNQTHVSDNALKEDTTVAYTNAKSGVIPTGIIMTVAPFAAVTLLGGAGVVSVVMKKKKRDDEED